MPGPWVHPVSADIALLVAFLVREVGPLDEVDSGQLWRCAELVDRAVRVLGVEASMPDYDTAERLFERIATAPRSAPATTVAGRDLVAGGVR